MRGYLDIDDKKNEIRMLLQHPSFKNKVLIIVEGSTDVRLFRDLLTNEEISISPVDGKKDLKKIITDLTPELPNKFLGICDSDFDHLTSDYHQLNNKSIFLTDHHDAEVMMINSPSLTSFVHEYSNEINIDTIKSGILESALSAGYVIGLLRWVNLEHHLNINFKGLNYSEFIEVNRVTVSVDIAKLIGILIDRSSNLSSNINIDNINELAANFKERNACKLQVANGHDVTNIIALIFRQAWASVERNMDYKKVETSLRLAYQKIYFSQTNLAKALGQELRSLGIIPSYSTDREAA